MCTKGKRQEHALVVQKMAESSIRPEAMEAGLEPIGQDPGGHCLCFLNGHKGATDGL